jgi:hypothetical protein
MNRSLTLTAAIATVLSAKFAGGSAEVVPREPESYPAPSPAWDVERRTSHSAYSSYGASEAKKEAAKRKRKKIAKASRKRNRT